MENDFEPTFAPETFGESTATAVCTAETAECTCPDFCERDHENE